jgi:predicted ABC-type ATPase
MSTSSQDRTAQERLTFARKFLPTYADCRKFINADLIAQGVLPFSPESAAIRAGRLMLEEIELSMRRRADFGFETTLSGRTHLGVLRDLRERAYQVHFFYLWIANVELALARIAERVLRGGHNVPEAVVRRRFERSIANFLVHYRFLADRWILFDNSTAALSIVASQEHGEVHITERKRYNELVKRYGK